MTIENIDFEFSKLINERGCHNKMLTACSNSDDRRLLAGRIRNYRYALRHGVFISIEIKMGILKMAGIIVNGPFYSRNDLIEFAVYISRQSGLLKNDINYALEKWEYLRYKKDCNNSNDPIDDFIKEGQA